MVVGALPGHRGVVATCNYAAREFGIHSAMPISEAYRRCPDAVYLRPDMAKYTHVSRDVFRILGTITPVIEPEHAGRVWPSRPGSPKIIRRVSAG